MGSKLPPPLIAIIGCDGSGKSTICEHLTRYVSQYGPTARVHLGKQAGNVGRQAAKLPILGKSVGNAIERNRKRVVKSQVGILPALVMAAFVIRRALRFRHMLALRKRGLIILTDRYPQIEVSGAYDGIVMPEKTTGNPLVRCLAAFEKRAFYWMASYKPDLVLRLNVDIDVACARKPDHRRESLAKKVAITSRLNFPGSQLVDIDVNQPLETVLSCSEKAVSSFMQSRDVKYAEQPSTLKNA